MKKGIKITLIIIGVILALVVLGGLFVYFKYLRTSNDVAVLNVKAGAVEVDSGKGWVKASDGMSLSLKDKIRTLTDGTAMVVLYQSILVTLEPNTEVTIKSLSEKNVVVRQESGSTWNKFSDLAGVKAYNVETPTTVATVRGTGFNVEIKGDLSLVDVGEGTVDVSDGTDKLSVTQNMRASKKTGEKLLQGQMDPEMKAKIAKNMVADLDNLKQLRKQEIMKHKDLIETARAQYKFTDEQMYSYLDKIDSGELNDEELIAKSPVKLPALQKLKKMDDNIKKQRALLEKLDSELDASDVPAAQKQQIKQQIKERLNLKQLQPGQAVQKNLEVIGNAAANMQLR